MFSKSLFSLMIKNNLPYFCYKVILKSKLSLNKQK